MMFLTCGRLSRIATAALMLSLPAAAHAGGQNKDDKKQQEKVDQLVREERAAMSLLADQAMAGQGLSTVQAQWHNDFLKGRTTGRMYVPFTIIVDPAGLPAGPLAMYLRIVPKGSAAAPMATSDKKTEAEKTGVVATPRYPFEIGYTVQPQATTAAGGRHITRAAEAPAGDQDVYVVFREKPTATAAAGTVPKSVVLKFPLTVPDFWNNELATSTVILASQVQPAKEIPSTEEQAERPYTLGKMEIVPSLDGKFSTKGELPVLFFIYNPGLGQDKKPDLNVEYAFYQKAGEAEKYFNKTETQTFNGQTLPPEFDLAAGYQISAGQAVPLASFPVGEYRLEIKVTDKISGKALTRSVPFTVAGS